MGPGGRAEEAGRTIILTTHYMEEAERLCDRVAIMDHGRVIALGTPKELIATVGGEDIVEFAVDSQDLRKAQVRREVMSMWRRVEGDSWGAVASRGRGAAPAFSE